MSADSWDIGGDPYALSDYQNWFRTTIKNIFTTIEQATKDLPGFVADGAVENADAAVETTKEVAELGTQMGIKVGDVVSNASNYGVAAGIGLTVAGVLAANPVVTGIGLNVLVTSSTIGTAGDALSTFAKGSDALFFNGSTDAFVSQAGKTVAGHYVGKIVTGVGAKQAINRFSTQGWQTLKNYYNHILTLP